MSSRHPLPGERVLAMNEKRLFSNRELAKILLPLVLQNILTITIGMADSIMVSGSGEAAFAGVSLAEYLNGSLAIFPEGTFQNTVVVKWLYEHNIFRWIVERFLTAFGK